MKSFALLALAAAVTALPQSSSSGCSPDVGSLFTITTVNLTKRSLELETRQAQTLTLNLKGGNLKDSNNRVGYIAANNQFQFDDMPQPGSKASTGWAACSNNSLALGGSTVFYQCLSGDFYNLYNAMIRPDCLVINLQIQILADTVQSGSPAVTQKTDGQPQATTAGRVSQITDGQPQATKPAVTQISDGQPQASRPASASKPAVSQIPDGQPQATKPAVSQIPDGQPQASRPATASMPAVSQIPDGQPQATKPAVSQISDGQPQATRPSVPTFTGGAARGAAPVGALAAGLFGLVALL